MIRLSRIHLGLGLSACLGLAVAAPVIGQAASGAPEINEYSNKDVYTPGDPLPMTKLDKVPGADMRKRLSFKGCPILMDAQPTPCWLIEHNGETYFLRAQQNLSADVHHPQLLHEVLVEGAVSEDESRICGGKVLNPLQLSILREINPACNEQRPAMTGMGAKLAKRPPGPGPSGKNRDDRNIRRIALMNKLDQVGAAYQRDPVEQKQKSFDVQFEFDSDFMYSYPQVTAAVKMFKDMAGKDIVVDVYRGSALLDDGTVIEERGGVVDDRLARLNEIFADYHVPPSSLVIRLHRQPAVPDGRTDFANRHVVLTVNPGP